MNPKYILSALLLFLFARMLAADSSEIEFPIEIAGLINYGCHDYQEPGLGYSIRYQNNTLVKVDIYVYDKNLKGIGNRSVSDLVQKEFSEVIQIFQTFKEMGKYKDLKEPIIKKVEIEDIPFLWAQVEYKQAPGEGVIYLGDRVSETYLTGIMCNFLRSGLHIKRLNQRNGTN